MLNKEALLNLEKRRCLYHIISKNPGLHLREIFRKTKISEGTVKYHIKYLESRGLIIVVKENGYTRFYIKDKIGKKDKELLAMIRQKVPRNIILYLLVYMVSSKVKLAKDLDLDPKLIEYHTKKLIEIELIKQTSVIDGYVDLESEELPRYKKFYPANNERVLILKDRTSIYDFFITYEDAFIKIPFIRDCISWIDFLKDASFPEKTDDHDEKFEKFMEQIYDIFPHPYFGC